MKRCGTKLFGVAFGLSLASVCLAQPTYTYTVIPPPDGTQSFYAWTADDGTIRGGSGLVNAGQGIQLRQCYTYKDSTWTVMPTPSANCYFSGATQNGDFTGTLQFPGDQATHFFQYHNGGFEMLDGLIPRTLPGPTFVSPAATNDQGDVAGWIQIQDLKPYSVPFGPPGDTSLNIGSIQSYGFLYSGGKMRELPKLSDSPAVTGLSTLGPFDYVYGMNSKGDLVGYAVLQIPGIPSTPYTEHAVLWPHDGGIVDLGTAGGTWSQANAINASGQIVGKTSVSADEYDPSRHNIYHAFFYENGSMTVLPVQAVYSVAQGISDDGGVVGFYYRAKDDGNVDFSVSYPFYWYRDGSAGGKVVDLQSLVPDLPAGMVLTGATIRGNGQIVATMQQSDDPTTATQVLLTPVKAQ